MRTEIKTNWKIHRTAHPRQTQTGAVCSFRIATKEIIELDNKIEKVKQLINEHNPLKLFDFALDYYINLCEQKGRLSFATEERTKKIREKYKNITEK